MSTTFTQTDTDSVAACAAGRAPLAVYCSTDTDVMSSGRLAVVGAGAGSGEVTLGIAAQSSTQAEFMWLLEPVDDTTPDAGNWTINFDFTTGAMTARLVSVFVCRMNSSCVDQSDVIVSVESLTTATDVGDQAIVINQGSSGTFNNGDKVAVVCSFENSAHGAVDVGITQSLTIVSPWTAPGGEVARRIFNVS